MITDLCHLGVILGHFPKMVLSLKLNDILIPESMHNDSQEEGAYMLLYGFLDIKVI